MCDVPCVLCLQPMKISTRIRANPNIKSHINVEYRKWFEPFHVDQKSNHQQGNGAIVHQ